MFSRKQLARLWRLAVLTGGVAAGLWLARPAAADLTDWCGQEGEAACPPTTRDFWSNGGQAGCDRGLAPNEAGVCLNHTRHLATPDAWAVETLQFQRELMADRPVNEVAWLSAHNAFNNLADGYTLANHIYSLSDQLAMGARHFMLDIYWHNDEVRLCHGVCGPRHRFFYHALRELDFWLRQPDNAQEVILLRLEAYVDDSQAERMNTMLALIFGTRLFTPAEKAPDVWPSLNELRALGKQVIIFSQDYTWGGEWVFTDWHEPSYPLDQVSHFNRDWPTCTYHDNEGNSWGLDRAAFSEFYESRLLQGQQTGLITEAVMRDLTACQVSVMGTDRLVPTRSAHAVWSWAPGQPDNLGGCAYANPADGRWLEAACDAARPFACVQMDDPTQWRVTVARAVWADGAAHCAAEYPGFVFGRPANGYENRFLHLHLTEPTWLNLTHQTGRWQSAPQPLAAPSLWPLGVAGPGILALAWGQRRRYLSQD